MTNLYLFTAAVLMWVISFTCYPLKADIIRVKHNHKTPQPKKPKRVESLLPETKEKSIQKEIENAEKQTELAHCD